MTLWLACKTKPRAPHHQGPGKRTTVRNTHGAEYRSQYEDHKEIYPEKDLFAELPTSLMLFEFLFVWIRSHFVFLTHNEIFDQFQLLR